MRLLGCADAFERSYLRPLDGLQSRHAGADRLTLDDHRARAALAQAAAELGTVQLEIVTQRVQQRGRGIQIQRMGPPINFESDCHVVYEFNPAVGEAKAPRTTLTTWPI